MTENKWLEKTWSFLLDPSQTAHWSPVGQRFSRALGGAGRRACCPTETGPVLTKEARQAQGLGWKSALHLSNPSGQGYPHSLGIQGLPNPEGLWSHSPAICISTPTRRGACAIVFCISGWRCETSSLSNLPSAATAHFLDVTGHGYSSSVEHPFDF